MASSSSSAAASASSNKFPRWVYVRLQQYMAENSNWSDDIMALNAEVRDINSRLTDEYAKAASKGGSDLL